MKLLGLREFLKAESCGRRSRAVRLAEKGRRRERV
jgi:hypothetical protein